MMHDVLATRRFTEADQEDFAGWSGDRNPIHLDAEAARQAPAGARLIHGVHGALWALGQLVEHGADLSGAGSLKVQFNRYIHLDRDVTLSVTRRDATMVKAVIALDDGSVATSLTWRPGPAGKLTASRPSDLPQIQVSNRPAAPAFSDMNGLAGWFAPESRAAKAPGQLAWLCQVWGERNVHAIAQLSTLVGMSCPGLHSLFSSFSIALGEGAANEPGLAWKTLETDDRFRIVTMAVWGPTFSGEVTALAREGPIERPSLDRVLGVEPGLFAGRAALVIGGSRGLGAATALLLAAGGAQVTLTYASDKAGAELVAADIAAMGRSPEAQVLSCDAQGDFESQLGAARRGLTHLYYFATPRIFRQHSSVYTPAVFDEFARIYVDRFAAAADWLTRRDPGSLRSILYPSSVAVTDRPRGMTEYAMAKAAGEVLCADLAEAIPNLTISTPRLPRILTNQTAVTPPVEAADAVDVMVPLLLAET